MKQISISRIVSIVTLAFLLPSVCWAERWVVTEGPGGEWKGDWLIEKGRSDFPCAQRSSNSVLQANCIIIRQGNRVAISKRNVSDGNPCNYFGEVKGLSASGEYFCRNGGPYSWSAVISR
jgi:hypothetical protein